MQQQFGRAWIVGESTLRRETLCFLGYRVKLLPWSPKGFCFRGFGALSAKVIDKSAQHCAGSLICTWKLSKLKKYRCAGRFWKMRSAKMCTRLYCRESSVSHQNRKKWHVRSSAGFVGSGSHCQRRANVGRFTATLLLCGCAMDCDKTHWHRCAQHLWMHGWKHSWARNPDLVRTKWATRGYTVTRACSCCFHLALGRSMLLSGLGDCTVALWTSVTGDG